MNNCLLLFGLLGRMQTPSLTCCSHRIQLALRVFAPTQAITTSRGPRTDAGSFFVILKALEKLLTSTEKYVITNKNMKSSGGCINQQLIIFLL